MPLARNIVYKYDDRWLPDEFEVDSSHELSFKIGDVVARHGKLWKVQAIHLNAAETPTLFIFFVNAAVN